MLLKYFGLYFLKCDSNSPTITIPTSRATAGNTDNPIFADLAELVLMQAIDKKYIIK